MIEAFYAVLDRIDAGDASDPLVVFVWALLAWFFMVAIVEVFEN